MTEPRSFSSLDFFHLIAQPEDRWNLFDVALSVARIPFPQLQLSTYQEKIDEYRLRASKLLEAGSGPYEVINAINQVLFQEEGFQGNVQDYYNPLNSYLSSVMDRKLGIPVSLCILFHEVAARMDLVLEPVGMPGHFLLKYAAEFHDLFVDPFNGGQILVREECRARFEELYGETMDFQLEFLDGISFQAVILRMLMNLKKIYREQNNARMLIAILEHRIPLLDNALPEILERGLARVDLEEYRRGYEDLKYFVEHTRDRRMKELIEPQLERIRNLAVGN